MGPELSFREVASADLCPRLLESRIVATMGGCAVRLTAWCRDEQHVRASCWTASVTHTEHCHYVLRDETVPGFVRFIQQDEYEVKAG